MQNIKMETIKEGLDYFRYFKIRRTIYLVEDDNANLHMIEWGTDRDNYGCSPIEFKFQHIGMFLEVPCHNLWIGAVNCYENKKDGSGIQTRRNIPCNIVAKKTFIVDKSQPFFNQISDREQSSNFEEILTKFNNKTI